MLFSLNWIKCSTFCRRKFTICLNTQLWVYSDIFPTRCNITRFIYFWKTAVHVLGGISTHHQEHTQLYLQHLVHVKPLLLPPAIVEELELVWVWCGNCIDLFWCGCCSTQNSSNSSTTAAGISNGLTSARCCKYSCVCSWWWVEIPPETCRAVFKK